MIEKTAALVLVAVLVCACRGDSSSERNSAEVGFETLLAKKTMKGATLAKHDGPTLVTVFATWCGPCRRELASIDKLRGEHPRLRVIGLNAYEDFDNLSNEAKLKAYLGENAPWLTVVRDPDKSLIKSFGGVPKIPTSFVFDSRGKVVAEFRRNERSIPSRAELDEAIRTAR